jgi:flagellar biosynthesis/type III secretory pathway protein FliH
MPNQLNLWYHLSRETQTELIEKAYALGLDAVYIWYRPYFELRDSIILRRYSQLKRKTEKTNQQLYDQIASEISSLIEQITPKVVEHVVLSAKHSRTI